MASAQSGREPRTITVPVLRHGLTTWNREALPQVEFDGRVDSLRYLMASEGFDRYLVYGNALYSGAIAYLTNFHINYPARGAILQVTGDHAKIFAQMPSRNAVAAQRHVGMPIVAARDVPEAIARLAAGVDRGERVAVSGIDQMPWRQAEQLEAAFDAVVERNWLDDLRRTKSSSELGFLRASAAIAEAALAETRLRGRAEESETHIAGRADYVARRLGCQDARTLFSSDREATTTLRRPLERRLRRGETVRVLTAVQLHGYWTEVAATYQVSDGGLVETDAGRAAAAALRCAAAASRDGAPATVGEGAAARLVWAHGIGLDYADEPVAETTALRQGDVVTLGVQVDGKDGGALAGGAGVVTGDGIELFI